MGQTIGQSITAMWLQIAFAATDHVLLEELIDKFPRCYRFVVEIGPRAVLQAVQCGFAQGRKELGHDTKGTVTASQIFQVVHKDVNVGTCRGMENVSSVTKALLNETKQWGQLEPNLTEHIESQVEHIEVCLGQVFVALAFLFNINLLDSQGSFRCGLDFNKFGKDRVTKSMLIVCQCVRVE